MSPSESPEFVTDLVACYGGPSEAGFGSAVFFRPISPDALLETSAREVYRLFVGALWERWGEEAWLGPWKQVYGRPPGASQGIVAELRGLSDPPIRSSVSLILDTPEDPEGAARALSAAFDDEAMTELSVFRIGDGEAMSGLLIGGRRAREALFVVALTD